MRKYLMVLLRMKYLGCAMFLSGIWLTSTAWWDPVEGIYLRPVGVIIGVIGIFLMLEGFKREIIEALREESSTSSNKT